MIDGLSKGLRIYIYKLFRSLIYSIYHIAQCNCWHCSCTSFVCFKVLEMVFYISFPKCNIKSRFHIHQESKQFRFSNLGSCISKSKYEKFNWALILESFCRAIWKSGLKLCQPRPLCRLIWSNPMFESLNSKQICQIFFKADIWPFSTGSKRDKMAK